MTMLGLYLPDEVSGTPPNETIRYAKLAEEEGFHSVWHGEATWGNSLIMLGAVARATNEIGIGTAILNVFSRSPSLLGMSVATLDSLSAGRTILGLGVSTEAVVEDWHGLDYNRPILRMKEYIEIIREAVDGGQLEYDGELFDIGPYTIGFDIDRQEVPLYNAAMGPVNRRLTGEFADGWLPIFIPVDEISEAFDEVADGALTAGRDPTDITVAPMIITAVDVDPNRAESYVRKFFAQELAMGYYRVVNQYGYGSTPKDVHDLWNQGDRERAEKTITDTMLRDLTIFGTPQQCRDQIEAYKDAGCDLPILLPPFGAPAGMIENTITRL